MENVWFDSDECCFATSLGDFILSHCFQTAVIQLLSTTKLGLLVVFRFCIDQVSYEI